MSEVRILVCGDRNWTDSKAIYDTLNMWHLTTGGYLTIIEGAARGADQIAGRWATAKDVPLEEYPADWKNETGILKGAPRSAAGPIRNQQMLDEGKPTRVIAFHDDLSKSKGTADMIRRAKKAGLVVYHFYHELKWEYL